MTSYYKTLPEGVTPGWALLEDKVRGKLVGFQLSNPKFGTLNYGRSPAGPYDTWWFEEVGGGGSVIVPYAVSPNGGEYVGMIQQTRPLQDEVNPVWGFPRGFKPPEMTHQEAAEQEFREETGTSERLEIIHLGGDGGNPNNAFFDSRQGGMQFYTVKVPWETLAPNPQGVGYVFQDNELTTEQKLELIQRCVFISASLHLMAELGDMITQAAFLRWLAFSVVPNMQLPNLPS